MKPAVEQAGAGVPVIERLYFEQVSAGRYDVICNDLVIWSLCAGDVGDAIEILTQPILEALEEQDD